MDDRKIKQAIRKQRSDAIKMQNNFAAKGKYISLAQAHIEIKREKEQEANG